MPLGSMEKLNKKYIKRENYSISNLYKMTYNLEQLNLKGRSIWERK